jgi:hypothetical protein
MFPIASLIVGALVATATSAVASATPSDHVRGTSPHVACLPAPTGPPVAPYIDVTLSGQPTLAQIACASGLRQFSLAFFTASSPSTCAPSLAGSSFVNATLASQISAFRSSGGDVIGSFGGAAGTELALACRSASALANAYQRVITAYSLTSIDFDVEGTAVTNAAANVRRDLAIAALERAASSARRPLTVSFTLEVEPQGLGPAELALVRGAIAHQVRIGVINIMTMDFGDGPAPRPAGRMGGYVLAAARSTASQLKSLYPSRSTAQISAMLGLIPMIGQNDEVDEVFSLFDARAVRTYAVSHGLGRLSFWSVTRDQPCAGGVSKIASGFCSGVAQTPYAYSAAMTGRAS